MAKLGKAFDSNKHDDMNNFEPVPAAAYTVKITKSDLVATKDKKGKYISLEFEIMKGDYKGRKIWTNLNIINNNPVAVEIAEKELATICRACGKSVIQDTQQLHGIPLLMKVRIVPPKGDYPPKNAQTGYKAIGAAASGPIEEESSDDESAPWESDVEEQESDEDIPF